MRNEGLRISLLVTQIATCILSCLLLKQHKIPPWSQLLNVHSSTGFWSLTIICNCLSQFALLVSTILRSIQDITNDIPEEEFSLVLFSTLTSIFVMLSHLFNVCSCIYRYQKMTLSDKQARTFMNYSIKVVLVQAMLVVLCIGAIVASSWPQMGWWRWYIPLVFVGVTVLIVNGILTYLWTGVFRRIDSHLETLEKALESRQAAMRPRVLSHASTRSATSALPLSSSDTQHVSPESTYVPHPPSIHSAISASNIHQPPLKPIPFFRQFSRLVLYKLRIMSFSLCLVVSQLACAILFISTQTWWMDYTFEVSCFMSAIASIYIFGSIQLVHCLRKGFHTDTPNTSDDGFTEAHVAYLKQQDEMDGESILYSFGVNSMISTGSSTTGVSGTYSATATSTH